MYESLQDRLPVETLLHLFTELEMTDKEISKVYGVDRTYITHLRKVYKIPSRQTIGRLGEIYVIEKLRHMGFFLQDMYETDKLAAFDILIDGEIRVDVKTSSMNNDGYFRFFLSEKEKNGNKVGKNRIRLHGGRTRKLYRKTCDVLILVCWEHKAIYVIPSADIPDKQGRIVLSENSKRYQKYRYNWGVIDKMASLKATQSN